MNEIKRHTAAGPVVFGMSRAEVRRTAPQPLLEARKLTAYALSEQDWFPGYTVEYDKDDRAFSVEFTRDAAPVTFDGYDLFGHSAREVREWARALDPTLDPTDGFTSRQLGVSIYAPLIDELDLDPADRDAPPQTVLVFRPGYFEEEEARIKSSFGIPNS